MGKKSRNNELQNLNGLHSYGWGNCASSIIDNIIFPQYNF